MEDYKCIKKIDKLGKIVLPIRIRNILELKENDLLQFWIEGNTIKVNKFEYRCTFCEKIKCVKLYKNKFICDNCITEIKKISYRK